jgi:hypothetical protein
VRWWRYALGGALLVWLLGTAYLQARRRNRQLGIAVLLLGLAVMMFATAAVVPRPPMTDAVAPILIVGSVVLLGAAMAAVLLKGFRE